MVDFLTAVLTYAALADALPSGTEARRIFAARIKPSPFFIYNDPDATDSKSWSDLQEDASVNAYDLVATRFMVDHDLQPFIEEGRNNLSALLNVMMELYDSGNADGARYFCRLIPQYYSGYSAPTLPKFCDTHTWVSWNLSMGAVGFSTRLAEASLNLLPGADRASDAENRYRSRAIESLLTIEAYYGSPDTFFEAYEQMVGSSAEPDIDMIFYAAVISDDADQALANLDAVFASSPESDDSVTATRTIQEKLSLVGGEIARNICRSDDERISAVLRGIMCVTGQEYELVPYGQIESDIRNGLVDRNTPGVTDWPFLRIAGHPAIQAAIADNISAFIPGILRPFAKRESQSSAPAARERLQVLLAHERASVGDSDLVKVLRDEILAAIAKHMQIDGDKVSVKMERGPQVSTLAVDVEIPFDAKMRAA